MIKKTYRKLLSIKFNSFSHSYLEFFEMDNTVDIHTKNLRLLIAEIFKTIFFLNPPIMWNSFTVKQSPFDVINGLTLEIPKHKSKARAIKSFDFRAVLAWNSLKSEIEIQQPLSSFKRALKQVKIYCGCGKRSLY